LVTVIDPALPLCPVVVPLPVVAVLPLCPLTVPLPEVVLLP